MVIEKYRTELNQNQHNILVKESTADYDCDVLNSPDKATSMLNDVFNLNRLAEEHLYLIALTTKYHPLGVFEVSHGSVSASICNPREIFVRLLLCAAASFMIAHNHPSGDTEPSDTDRNVTYRLKECADMIGVEFTDHIIVGNGYYSFRMNTDLL